MQGGGFWGAGTGAKALCKSALRKKGPVQQLQFCAALSPRKKGPVKDRPLRCILVLWGAYSRLPKNCSKNMNMLMKSMYRLSAPMIAALPIHSLSPECACCR